MTKERSNIKAGIFVLSGLIVGIVIILILSGVGSWFKETRKAQVSFQVSDNLNGLKPGAIVLVGGKTAGSVIAVDPFKNEEGVLEGFIVTFTLEEVYPIYDNARISIKTPMLGGGASLEIIDLGGPAEDGTGEIYVMADGVKPIVGEGAPNFLGFRAADMKNVSKIMSDAAEIVEEVRDHKTEIGDSIDNFKTTTDDLKFMVADVRVRYPDLMPKLEKAIVDGGDALEDIKAAVAAFREYQPKWMERVDKVTVSAYKIFEDVQVVIANVRENEPLWSGKVTNILTDGETIMTDGKVVAEDLKVTTADVKDIVQTNKGKVNNTMARLDSTATQVDELVTSEGPKVKQIITDGGLAVEQANSGLAEVRSLLSENRPTINHSIANIRLASDQLKLAIIEIRRNPWRLLYSPSPEELKKSQLYAASRNFSLAAGSMESTVAALREVLDKHGDSMAAQDPHLKLLVENLKASTEKFTEAQQRFYEALENEGDD